MSKKIKFPKDFWWGGAMSAEQTEGSSLGVKGQSIFDYSYMIDPESYFDGVGPDKAIKLIETYKDDIKLWSELKINSIRTSISWTRIFPEGDYSKPCKESVDWYHNYIDEMINNGISPIMTLYHFDMPERLQKIGGFESREVWYEFLEFSKFVFKEYGGKIKYWTTMNEPWAPVHNAYISNIQYPYVNDSQRGINAAYGIVMAHALVVNHINSVKKDQKIGGVFNSAIVYPRDKNNPEDVKAAKYLDLYEFTGVTDPMIMGKWNPDLIKWVKEMNMVPENFEHGDIEELEKVNIDWIGLNFYMPQRAKSPDKNIKSKHIFDKYFQFYNMPNKRENKFRGWEIYPEAVYDTFKKMIDRYGRDKEYMLTEYGMGAENENIFRNKNGIIEDDYRVSFMKEHLMHYSRIMNDYPDVKFLGAHVWSIIDCWSWGNAFKNRYGMIEVDLKDNSRRVKKSGEFLKKLIEEGEFDSDFKRMEEYIDFKIIEYNDSIK